MLAIHLTRFGEPEQSLKVVDVPEPPPPAAGQALIQVEYAPLDHHDLLLAQGIYPVRPELPSVIGNEGAGTVLAVGPDVTQVRPGDTVLLPFGTFAWAEQVLADAAKLTVVDQSIGLDQAAMLRINPTTGGLLVESRDLPAGSWLVQNAANSGVGRSVIAFARERGLRTINIVRREEAVGELEELGADLVLVGSPTLATRVRAVIGDDPVLLGLDGVSGHATSLLLDVLTEGALLVIYGYMSGKPFTPDQNVLTAKNITTTEFWMYQDAYLPRHAALGAESARLVAEGKLTLPSAPVYKADAFAEALAYLRKNGKVLLDFNPHRT
ncbi:zinc-dependent alcohol dehydrogenase family protein [Streptomyces sp. Ag109_G2-15]|uniref:zinc-dependent alcohol dehydrogenase family protein n=1 Tax=Streptomyces sp. Ag109_G2-15 TaxID=1938850 RepID=UPI000BD877EC|nr:zinc-dependent alcohol dehydrogenase family protein [Streptomyces sp. Ag109_G2-15]SOD90166.1 NADPH:quinone reductase [Streptomyces sp. Ag109_G2-15]